jgi:hypothetical protein
MNAVACRPARTEEAMRALLILLFIAVPSLAAAKPQLKCEFEGNKTKVTIVNDENKRQLCHYNCSYELENGAGAAAGSIGVGPGETKVVSERERSSKVKSVRESKLECE